MGDAQQFFRTHPVFTLDQFRQAVGGRATAATTRTLVKYHLGRGALRSVEKSVYAVVPPGLDAKQFLPDRFVVIAALREDAVLAYHSALELLGHAHSTYRDAFYFTGRRRKDLRLGGGTLRAVLHPKPLRDRSDESYGVEVRERLGVKVRVTGPERTLVDCLSIPRYAGGVEEAFQSLQGVPSLNLDRLAGYLERLGRRRLFAAVGAFLERDAARLFVIGDVPVFVVSLADESWRPEEGAGSGLTRTRSPLTGLPRLARPVDPCSRRPHGNPGGRRWPWSVTTKGSSLGSTTTAIGGASVAPSPVGAAPTPWR